MHSTNWLKDLLRGYIPPPLLRARQRWRQRRRERDAARLWRASGGQVLSGPFRGMRYVERAVGSALGPKLLGCYEAELHPAIESLAKGAFDRVVVVGAGEGYYAVGLLLRLARVRGWAFEAEEQGRNLVREQAALNGVGERLSVGGLCQLADLAASLEGAERPLVVMDVEGAEDELLDPSRCPSLVRAAVLVEVHEALCPGVTGRLLERFGGTHAVDRIPTTAACAAPAVPGFTRGQLWLLADEMRAARMEWMLLTPRP